MTDSPLYTLVDAALCTSRSGTIADSGLDPPNQSRRLT
jgi:hypothetical protein